MKFLSMMTNELPFMLEIPNGIYEVNTSIGKINIDVNSDMFKLNTSESVQSSGKVEYVGEADELKRIIKEENIFKYTFGECKTFVSFRAYKDIVFNQENINAINEQECIESIKTDLIMNKIEYEDSKDLELKAKQALSQMDTGDLNNIKVKILIKKEFVELNNVGAYYEAVNKLISQYSYLRNHFWVNKIDANILEGTLIQNYIDGQLFDSITYANLVPSIMPSRKKYPDISNEENELFRERLSSDFQTPIEDELILIAKSLWYRLEYRSAIIESSAALEVMVEKKLVEKMKEKCMDEYSIQIELNKTLTNFRQRCDVFLKKYTGKSFENDNSTLWNIINEHRNNYRHKIAHSDIVPDRDTTKKIIDDFENGIKYISSL